MKLLNRLLLVLLVLAALSISASHAQNTQPEKVIIVQWGKERILLYLPLYVAMEEGLFTKRGLDVDLQFGGNMDQVFATVISGSAQFGVADPVATAFSHDKGGPGKTIAMMLTKLAFSGVTNKDSVQEIKTPQDLDGLRVGSFPEPSTGFTLLNEIKHKNNLKNMTIVQAPIGGQIALLEAGKADLAIDSEPSVSIFEDKGYRVVFSLASMTDSQVITGITTTEDVIKNRPQTVQKIVDGVQEAINLIYNDPEIAYRVSRKLYPNLFDKVIHAAVDRMMSAGMYPRSVVVVDNLWQRTLKTRLDSGELRKPQTTDVAVDNRFAMQAQKDLSATTQ